MSTTFSPAFAPGTTITTASGRYLVESSQLDVPPGYILARRAERPMTHPRAIRVSDIIGSAPSPVVSAAACAP